MFYFSSAFLAAGLSRGLDEYPIGTKRIRCFPNPQDYLSGYPQDYLFVWLSVRCSVAGLPDR
jgi:hypothetical protein